VVRCGRSRPPPPFRNARDYARPTSPYSEIGGRGPNQVPSDSPGRLVSHPGLSGPFRIMAFSDRSPLAHAEHMMGNLSLAHLKIYSDATLSSVRCRRRPCLDVNPLKILHEARGELSRSRALTGVNPAAAAVTRELASRSPFPGASPVTATRPAATALRSLGLPSQSWCVTFRTDTSVTWVSSRLNGSPSSQVSRTTGCSREGSRASTAVSADASQACSSSSSTR
jgi:hypothetical protein